MNTKNKICYVLFDPKAKCPLEEKNSKKIFPIASVTKIFTAYLGAEIVGGTWRYSTNFKAKKIGNRLLVKVKGNGDPTLGILELSKVAAKIPHAVRIEIRIFKNVAKKRPIYFREKWNAYNCSIGDVSIANNQTLISWSKENGKIRVDSEVFGQEVRVWTSTKNPRIQSILRSNGAWLVRTNKINGEIVLPVHDPNKCFSETLLRFLQLRKTYSKRNEVELSIKSQPLKKIVRRMLKDSNNLFAETIGLTILRQSGSKNISVGRAAEFVEKEIKRRFGARSFVGLKLKNCSGLTPKNTASCESVATFLRHARKNAIFFKSLSLAGIDGTLKVRMKSKLKGRVNAKTGNLKFSSSIAGYMKAKSGRRLIFCIGIWEPTMRKKMDGLMKPLSPQEFKNAMKWTDTAIRHQDRILMDWFERY